MRFRALASACLALYALLYIVGAHYTWLVPYDRWAEQLVGLNLAERLGFPRNHYDRLVHFAFGLLWYLPFRELLQTFLRVSGGWALVLPVALILSLSNLYEVFEWLVVVIFRGGPVSETYVGLQGDMWDTHKDMGLSFLGGLTALLLAVLGSLVRARRRGGARTAA